MSEPPSTVRINGLTYELLLLDDANKERLRQEIRTINASYAYWIRREELERFRQDKSV